VVSQKLTDYIKQQSQKGKDRETIVKKLTGSGWEKSQVEEAFSRFDKLGSRSSVSPRGDSSQKQSITSPFDLLSEAWSLYKSRFKTLVGVVLIPPLVTIVAFVVAAIAFAMLGLVFGLSSTFSVFDDGSVLAIVVFVVIFLAIFVIFFIIQVWGQVALVVAVKDSSEAIGIRESFKRSRSKILSFWWVMSLAGLIVVGGYILFLIPGLIIGVWFSLALYVLVSEDVRGMNALLKSREYVKGRWWAVFGRFFFIGLLSFTVYVVPSFLFEFLDLSWVGSIYSWLVSLVLTPVVVIYSFLLYKNIKFVKGDFEFTPTGKSKVALIVVGILGTLLIPVILGIIVLVAIDPAAQMSKARDAVRVSHQSSIKQKLDRYFLDEGEYPTGLDQLVPGYFPELPKDPSSDLEYEYVQLESGASYEFCVDYELEPRECVDPSSNLMEMFPLESDPVD